MIHLKLTIHIQDPYQESLIAELLDLDFEGFEQFDDKIIAWIPKPRFNDVSRERIEQLLTDFPGENFVEFEELEEQNWNETWEKTVKPQIIGHFFVKPTWSSAKAGKGQILLEIDPKMSFGTGYHATTRLMLRALPELNLRDKQVLDAGTGTGILGIASLKLGAEKVFAFDIDEWSFTNATENAYINRVQNKMKIAHGGVECIPENEVYDVILVNINRNAILEMFQSLVT